MKQITVLISSAVLLSGCSAVTNLADRPWLKGGVFSRPAAMPAPVVDATPDADAVAPVIVSPITDEPRPAPSGSGLLGTTIASLGDVTKEGFWIETPLVASPAKGRVRYPATGREVKVDLIPLTGLSTGGSYLSLGAMQLLNAPLASLPEVEVFQN